MTSIESPSSAELTKLASGLAQASRSWPFWSTETMEQWKTLAANGFEKALLHVDRKPLPAVDWNAAKNGLEGIFMLDVTGHALGSKAVCLGFEATETQSNQALGHFLGAGAPTNNIVRHRVRALLAALYEDRPEQQEVLSSFDASAKFEVDAERSVKKQGTGRRMDLVIGWPSLESGQCQHILVVEIKFGHKVTKGQLSGYRKFAKKGVNDLNQSGLFLLTPEGKSAPRNKDWTGISWMMLLRKWEQYLATGAETDTDHDFIRLRRMLWQRIH